MATLEKLVKDGSICVAGMHALPDSFTDESSKDADALFAALDTDGDGVISKKEWRAGADAGLLQGESQEVPSNMQEVVAAAEAQLLPARSRCRAVDRGTILTLCIDCRLRLADGAPACRRIPVVLR